MRAESSSFSARDSVRYRLSREGRESLLIAPARVQVGCDGPVLRLEIVFETEVVFWGTFFARVKDFYRLHLSRFWRFCLYYPDFMWRRTHDFRF